MKNYYTILGIGSKATEKEIKKAYRKLALHWHPDKNKSPEAEDKFIEITEAYDVLSDRNKRARYDSILAGKSYYTKSKTTYTKKRKTYYDKWMEYQAEKARRKASQKAHMSYKQYKKEQFGNSESAMSHLYSAIKVFLGIFIGVAVFSLSKNSHGSSIANKDLDNILGAAIAIGLLLFSAWWVMRSQNRKKK